MYCCEDYITDLKIVNAVINKCFKKDINSKVEVADLRQIGLLGIVKGRNYYKNVLSKETTFYWNCAYKEILNHIKHINNLSHKNSNISLNDLLSIKDTTVTLEDVIEDKDFNFDDYTELIVIKDVLRKYIKSLPKGTNIEKITKLTLLGYSTMEIMEQLGCTISYINRIKLEFKAKLKIMLDKELR